MRCFELPWSACAAMSGIISVGTSQGAAGMVLAAQAAIAELLLMALVFWRAAADDENRAVQDRLRFLLMFLNSSDNLCRDAGKFNTF